jgi:hypothetical protein
MNVVAFEVTITDQQSSSSEGGDTPADQVSDNFVCRIRVLHDVGSFWL